MLVASKIVIFFLLRLAAGRARHGSHFCGRGRSGPQLAQPARLDQHQPVPGDAGPTVRRVEHPEPVRLVHQCPCRLVLHAAAVLTHARARVSQKEGRTKKKKKKKKKKKNKRKKKSLHFLPSRLLDNHPGVLERLVQILLKNLSPLVRRIDFALDWVGMPPLFVFFFYTFSFSLFIYLTFASA